MATPVNMPMLGLTMEEGTVAEWLKREGDNVDKDEPLLLVEMDKGTVEVPSPATGVLGRIVVQPGTTVAVKTLIAEIAAPGETLTPSAVAGGPGDLPAATATRDGDQASSAPTTRNQEQQQVSDGAGSGQGQRLFASPRARMRARESGVDLTALRGTGPHGRIVEADVLAAGTSRVVATPLARRLADEHGVSIDAVRGSGPGGRITQDDVLRAAERPAGAPTEPPTGVPAQQPTRALAEAELMPLSRVRRITAERMAASAQSTARVTLFVEADFSEAARFRRQLEPEFTRLGTPKLPWDAIVVRASALALAEHRAMLAQWADGDGLRATDGVHVGVAVTLEPEGLVVPVLRDADKRSLRDLASALLDLVSRARANRLAPAEMQGGGFSVTNLGGYRVDGFTPILNPPETAILGVGRIADKAVVVDGSVQARTMCTLSLSFDHRVVDGAPAAAFLARVAELLERPYALLGI